MHLNAKANEYQESYPEFDSTPKAVIAAIAYSLALRLSEDNHGAAQELLRDEWRHLHQSGLVPNKPRMR